MGMNGGTICGTALYMDGRRGLAPWRIDIAPENIGGVYGYNAMGSNPSASPRCEGDEG
jgi:hypothetical protein